MFSRRDFGKIALAAAPLSHLMGEINSKVHGVQLGAQSYSFRDRPLDEAIKAMTEVGIGEVELWQGHIEPPRGTAPEEIKKWRVAPETLDEMKQVKAKFDKAGIKLYALNYSFRPNNTDEEIEHGMK